MLLLHVPVEVELPLHFYHLGAQLFALLVQVAVDPLVVVHLLLELLVDLSKVDFLALDRSL